ncbi:MAG TPA: hypothetical protein VFB19_06025 [Mycobacterium sp.]|nr:hypothetical protein [Mycobacterium sp.]
MAGPYSEPYQSYPQQLPPPLPYPTRNRWRLAVAILAVVAVIAGTATAIVYATTAESDGSGTGQLTESSAKSAIQNYLDALLKGKTDVVARNSLCGFYDAVKDKRGDQALARLSSETFRKQFSSADVTSIDKLVRLAPQQAQVLFTMHVVPVVRGGKQRDEQGVATLVAEDDQVLVCQYVLKSGSQY